VLRDRTLAGLRRSASGPAHRLWRDQKTADLVGRPPRTSGTAADADPTRGRGVDAVVPGGDRAADRARLVGDELRHQQALQPPLASRGLNAPACAESRTSILGGGY